MWTKRRRHALTETPPVQQAREKLAQIREEWCLPFLLEAGYSARSGRDHDDLLRRKTHLAFESVWLARRGSL